MILLPDEILFGIAETQKLDPNLVSGDTSTVKPKKKIRAIFLQNLIKRDKKLLGRYTKRYFVQLFDGYLKNFSKEWKRINLLLTDVKEEKKGIVLNLANFFSNVWSQSKEKIKEKIKETKDQIYGWILNALKILWDAIKMILKWGSKKLIQLGIKIWNYIRKRGSKKGGLIRRAKALFTKLRNKFIKIYNKRIKPAIKKFFKWLSKRLKNVIKISKRGFKFFKKVFGKLFNFLSKILRKIVIKAVKKIVQFIVKQAIKWGLRALASALTATGIGAIIGAAIWALTIAMEAYDYYEMATDVMSVDSDVEGEGEEDEEEIEDPFTQSTPKKIKTQKFALRNAEEFVRVVDKDGSLVMGKAGSYRYSDDITKSLYNSQEQSFQIFGSLYEFYQHVFKWLEGQETFGVDGINAIVNGINEYNVALNDFLYSHLAYKEKMWREYAKTKYGVDFMNYRNRSDKDWVLKKSKGGPSRPKRLYANTDSKIKKVANWTTERWRNGKGETTLSLTTSIKFGRNHYTTMRFLTGETLNKVFVGTSRKSSESSNTIKNITKQNKFLEDSSANDSMLPQKPLSSSVEASRVKNNDENNEYFITSKDISSIGSIKEIDIEKTLTRYISARDNKIEALIDKNDLLYELHNRWAWYEKSIPIKV